MKARRIILGALLLALVVSPSAMRAMSRSLSAPACQAPRPRIYTTHAGRTERAPRKVADSLPGQNRPAPRLHRIRGKKISIQRGFVAPQRCSAQSRYLFAMAPVTLEDPDGPNPSRGPPTQISL